MTIGRLERVELREVWPHEALDFTRWLQENVEVLNDELDIAIANVEREQAAGSFSVDLVGEDEAGNPVIVENQLGKSDHDHLGKLITYLTAFEARTAIWIVSHPRPEHAAAITWLNQSTPVAFYLLKVEAVRIGESSPAPLLTKIVGPSEESREIGDTKKEFAERERIRYRFWSQHLDRAQTQTDLHENISPCVDGWLNTGGGRSGLEYAYVIHDNSARVELYISTGDTETNKAIFDRFYESIENIERSFGGALDWQRLEGKQACRIAISLPNGGYRNVEERWPEIQDAMIDAMVRLEKTFRPHIEHLPR